MAAGEGSRRRRAWRRRMGAGLGGIWGREGGEAAVKEGRDGIWVEEGK
jgi:hypothetical protein